AGEMFCASVCKDVTADEANCGGCDVFCPLDKVCTGGQCVCAAGLTSCNGACVDATQDAQNCGGCSVVCDPQKHQASCTAGQCGCDPGWADCNGNAADGCEHDIASDAQNCGACGHDCLGAACSASVCTPELVVAGNVIDFTMVGNTFVWTDGFDVFT